MKKTTILLFVYLFLLMGHSFVVSAQEKLVIAHRGASGYLPEHSLASKALAHGMNADFIEQDLVMTKDDQLVVLHDHFLDRVTNVKDIFPHRMRQDGRFYVIDFTLAEIQTLKMTDGFKLTNNKTEANFPNRFPLWKSNFKVHTFADEIELIQGLNKSTGKNIGIYPEIKSPSFHRHHGKDISTAVLTTLKRYGYTDPLSNIILQSFDANELIRIKTKLFKQLEMDLPLVQLIAMTNWRETINYQQVPATNYNFDWMLRPSAMKKIAKYANGIGPWYPMLISKQPPINQVTSNGLVAAAHQAGLFVHPYTFRADDGSIPDYADDFNHLMAIFYYQLNVDGIFTDFPDKAIHFLQQQ